MSRQEDDIIKCAKRMIEKLEKSPYSKMNGEYPKKVQTEIKRMIKHCKEIANG